MATIKDVAKKAGVGVSTVSKAYNNYSDVSASTKAKIIAAAKELNYMPNKSAVELSQGQRKYIGVIVKETLQGEFHMRLIMGVHGRTEQHGYEMVMYTTEHIKSKKLSYVEFCRFHSLVGAIVSGLDKDDPYLQELTKSKTPCVLIDIEDYGENTAFVATDNKKASYAVFELLYQHGHRHICHLTGGMYADVSHVRKDAFAKAASDYGVPSANLIYVDCDFDEALAYQNTQKILEQHPELTAIYAASDTMALGAMRAIQAHGYNIGEDFALIGFDGISILEYTSPPIATVEQNLVKMGEIAFDTLLKIYNGQRFEQSNYVGFTLKKRKSINQRNLTDGQH